MLSDMELKEFQADFEVISDRKQDALKCRFTLTRTGLVCAGDESLSLPFNFVVGCKLLTKKKGEQHGFIVISYPLETKKLFNCWTRRTTSETNFIRRSTKFYAVERDSDSVGIAKRWHAIINWLISHKSHEIPRKVTYCFILHGTFSK